MNKTSTTAVNRETAPNNIRIGMIWAQAINGVIGKDGLMPWHIPEDLAHFKRLTLGKPVIMGRRTWDSLPERFRPLEGRRNIVVTRQDQWVADGVNVCHSFASAVALVDVEAGAGASAGASAAALDASHHSEVDVWVIGGGEIYRQAMLQATILVVTEINRHCEGDTYAPQITGEWTPTHEQLPPWQRSRSGLEYRFITYTR
ncbi:dihydrofolate reductase [Lysinibacter sp. HNR]|uniref:dihydrofolate reductase n=1 Tax=Lysinibacter sp. HNR TaxID=3031408 RepID=UPI0024356306|nr:dihydrofolate reductase [Lysinibacter sp. HNR]WGD37698.1 dihydrofolate reductase [Lysinibacter sp. HNR]